MPVYTLNTDDAAEDKRKSFVKALTALHARTFHSDPAAVRVEFVLGPRENTRFRYGGYGFEPAKGLFGVDWATAHLVAQQEYCRKIVKLWGPMLRTVVLQRVEWEFEVKEKGRPDGHGRIEPALGRIVDDGLEGRET
ncbi:hypothetical protein B0H11DRAFT_2006920 [Mycena galericulata]|nr:hypothetical protein B0H11DRAFT_2006920 [Mycena galericulata]